MGIFILLLLFLRQEVLAMQCLDCSGVSADDVCGMTEECEEEKQCFVQEYTDDFGFTRYNMGCELNRECANAGATGGIIIGKRTSPYTRAVTISKTSCCDVDLCNKDLTILHGNKNPFSGTDCVNNNPTVCTDASVCSTPGIKEQCSKLCNGCGTASKQFFMEFSRMDGNPGGHIELLIVATQNGSATLNVPYLNLTKTISLHPGFQKMNISNSIIPSNMQIERKGVELTSTVPINLYAINYEGFNNDGFNVIPGNKLGTNYYVPTMMYSQQEVVIMSPYDANNVTITLSLPRGRYIYSNGQRYGDKDVIRLKMKKFDTYEVLNGNDFSGTNIQSTKPISVVSGDKCIHLEGVGCDHMIDMVPPVTTFSKLFVIPKLYERKNHTIQIIAAQDNTNVQLGSNYNTATFNLSKGEHRNVEISSAATLQASKGVLVTQFVHACCPPVYHEPFMMILPGVDRYLSEYNVAVFDDGLNFDNHLTIVISDSQLQGLRLDGKPLPPFQSTFRMYLDSVYYVIFDIPITPGAHHVLNENGATFALYVHGNRWSNGYGYSAGFRI